MPSIHPDRLDLLVLGAFWCKPKPASFSDIAGTLKQVLEAKEQTKASVQRLVDAGFVDEIAPTSGVAKYQISSAGKEHIGKQVGVNQAPKGTRAFTTFLTKILVARALDLTPPKTEAERKSFSTPIAYAVCARHHGLSLPLGEPIKQLRLELVRLALAKCNQVALDKIHIPSPPNNVLTALVVGPMLDVQGTALKLDSLVTSRAVGIHAAGKAERLPKAIIRQWLHQEEEPYEAVAADESRVASVATAPRAEVQSAPPAATLTIESFAERVRHALRVIKQRGDRRAMNNVGDEALINYVFAEYQRAHGDLTLEQFKEQLCEAGRSQRIILGRSDLVPEDRADDFRASEVQLGVSTYHYIRMQD